MEENENFATNGVINETGEKNETVNEGTEKKGLKNIKNLIILIVIIIIAIIVLISVFGNSKQKAKNVIKQYVKAMNKSDVKKMIKLSDPYGEYVFSNLDEDEYDDFWDEYKDFVKEKDDDYEDVKEEYEESLEKDNIEDAKETYEDFMEDTTIKLKKFSSVEEVSKNLYKVKARIESKTDDKKDTNSFKFYVMKKGSKCYIVGSEL